MFCEIAGGIVITVVGVEGLASVWFNAGLWGSNLVFISAPISLMGLTDFQKTFM